MNSIKLIVCITFGVLLGNSITFLGYKYFLETDKQVIAENKETPIKTTNVEVYKDLEPAKINITLKNGSDNELECGKMMGNDFESFLIIGGREERSYENIKEGEFIGCNIKIDGRSSTILTWFNATRPGVYTFLLEQVECKTCKGTNERWATFVVNPNGQREYQQL